jgi:hypothetical protein
MKCLSRVFFLLVPLILLSPGHTSSGAGAFARLPQLTLWAWQRPERLQFIDPQRVAVAYLDQTIFVGRQVRPEPRFQPMHVPPGTQVIAVARIEMPASALQTEEIQAEIVKNLLRSARRPGIAALQIDFDALKSQRAFYRHVLEAVRREMPAEMPLSITALASWCAFDNWIKDLPVNEAVPMMFRMGVESRLLENRSLGDLIREPLCSGSVGVSTDEKWPNDINGRRIYVFHVQPWTQESLNQTMGRMEK